MATEQSINRAFVQHFENVEKVGRRAMVKSVAAAYKHIMAVWPVFTGFSKANNHISITGRTIARLEPHTRPNQEGALIGKAKSIERSELAKLSRLKKESKDRVVVLGNSVPYAADVGFQTGKGLQIYEEGRQIATAILTRESRRKK